MSRDNDETLASTAHKGQDLDQSLLYAEDLARLRSSNRTLLQRLQAKGHGRRTILVADDEVSLRRLVNATLAADSYTVLEASRGTEALVLAQTEHPDLILLDVRMPDLDGFEVCRRIKSDPELKATPVVMLTSASLEEERQEGYAAGANSYLTKPFSPLQLLEVIQQLLVAAYPGESTDTPS